VRTTIHADALKDLLRPDNFMPLASALVRREWLERVGGFVEEYSLIEDVDLELRMVMQGAELREVPAGRPLFWYRQRPRSLSRRDPVAFVKGCVRNGRLAENYWREQGALTADRAELLAALYFWAARVVALDAPGEFERMLGYLHGLKPNFVPESPAALKWLSRGLGYPRAERVAVWFRQLKRTLARRQGGVAG
jgi:hypothetical protein